ncbi:tetratricopeptide repeat protein [Roseitranquillus sediminis]|uniref:tetratricopeptide repeat protein n=1 Tax=Roseitranquillus sediminis TaxID=2809051 RepID=UPI001D0C6572|nr:tetratricopeptide repeat protein [Roseitranquillus sediminis]MBM9593008.1 tetratricopeptide repeat protein [Roseitranquillus sediminis]
MDGHRQVASAVKDFIARQHISRDEFAFRTKLGRSTVDKLLIGLFSDRTLSIVEGHTGLDLKPLLNGEVAVDTAPAAAHRGPEAASRPSIAVLPFTNLGGDHEHDYLGDGLTEDIITALARLRWLFVIARNSTFVYKGRAVDVRTVAGELGVRYVLEGSIRVARDRIRVTGQLIDAESGKHIWADRYDRQLTDIFDVQDDITQRVVAAVEPHLYAEEGTRAALRQPGSVDAWGLVARALQLINQIDRKGNAEAQELLHRAITLDPSYARAHALLSWALYWAVLCYWRPDREKGSEEAMAHAQKALVSDPGDPWGRMMLGLCLSSAGQHDRAVGELRAALSMNPSFALGHTGLGLTLLRAGHFDEAIEETARALLLSPLDTFSGLYTSTHGLALLGARRFEEALPYLRTSIAGFSEYPGQYNSLISCCGHLGLLDEAREFMERRNAIGPPLRRSVLRKNLSKFAHCDVFIEGLEKAGVPD